MPATIALRMLPAEFPRDCLAMPYRAALDSFQRMAFEPRGAETATQSQHSSKLAWRAAGSALPEQPM